MPRTMSDITLSAYRSELLQRAKEKTGKNNSMLARETGLSRPSVISVVNGATKNLDLIVPVAKALGVAMDDLFAKAA